MSSLRCTAVSLLFIFSPAAFAQSPGTARPDETSLFGTPPSSVKPAAMPKPKTVQPEMKTDRPPEGRDEAAELESSEGKKDAFANGDVKDNPLQIGGKYYQRMIVSAQQGVSSSDTPISMPLQFDLYLDTRPNDRLRGFVDQRLLYDSTRNQYSNPTGGSTLGNFQNASTSGAPSSLGGAALVPNNPQTVLDQAWLKFDVDHTLYMTAGKQHVKWGPSRFWNPTDFLHTQRRDPLLPYDLRLGTTMLKVDLPLETKKTAIYGVALFDNPQPASTLGQMGGAFRAETLVGSTETGVEFVSRGGRNPVYGADVSAPLGPFDFYAETALISGASSPSYQIISTPTAGVDLSTLYSTSNPQGPFVQASGGMTYTFGWKESRLATVGVEYFYNQLGYSDAAVYPLLIFLNQYQPFYVGRNYAAFYFTAEGPDVQKRTSYTFSTLGNLSDKSFLSRLDFNWQVLTYLTFEAYVDVHYGTNGGEFNFSLNTPPMTYQNAGIAAANLPPTIYDVGLGLRIGF